MAPITKPGDHPEFFRFPAPPGRSRESTIVLSADGRFVDNGVAVEHRRLEEAMHTWISRHPDDGRYILTNGYDWTYFKVEDAPFTVSRVVDDHRTPTAILSDGTREPLRPTDMRVERGHLYARVKASAQGGPYDARFSRHAKIDLAPWLEASDDKSPNEAQNCDRNGASTGVTFRVGGESVRLDN